MTTQFCTECGTASRGYRHCHTCGSPMEQMDPASQPEAMVADGSPTGAIEDETEVYLPQTLAPPATAAPAKSKKAVVPVLLGALIAGGAIGGFALWRSSGSSDTDVSAVATTEGTSEGAAPVASISPSASPGNKKSAPPVAPSIAPPVAKLNCKDEKYAELRSELVNNWQVCSTPTWSAPFAIAAAEKVTGPGDYDVQSPTNGQFYTFTCADGAVLTCQGSGERPVKDFPSEADSPISRLYLAKR